MISDTQFEQAFASCTLPEEDFDHEAHLRLAWIHISKYGVEQAVQNVSTQIHQYTRHLGAEHVFNRTVTVAAVRAVHHFMQKTKADDFTAFIKEFPRLKTNLKDLLSSHYSFDIFQNEDAKKIFLEPDLAAFT